jgi:hypothetical protein
MRAQGRLPVWAVCVLSLALFASPSVAGGPPFAADLAGGKELPLPWGIGFTYYDLSQDYAIDRLALGIPGFDNLPLDRLEIDNEISSYTLKFDVWLLPFLNAFGIVGQIDGETDVDFRPLPLPIPLSQVEIEYDGDVYGGGITLAGGGEVWFVSATTIFTETSLDGDFESAVQSLVVMPRVGLYNRLGSVWVGAMYLETEENHRGVVDLPFLGPVPFEVDLVQEDDWNTLVGAQAHLGEHWDLELEAGFGDRETLSGTVTFRF